MSKEEMIKVLKAYYIQLQIDEVLPPEVYEIYVKPDFNTASWHFHRGVHKIVVGEDIFVSFDSQASKALRQKCLYSYFNHELGHSIWTYKDLKAINKMLEHDKIPFMLFNLFEDARIEEKMRMHIKKPFRWKEFESLATPTNALELFFFILQSEHSKSEILRVKSDPLFSQVFGFYKRVVLADDSFDVIEILKEWLEVFPLTKEYVEEMRYIDHLFVSEAEYCDEEAFEQLLEGAVAVDMGGYEGEKKADIKQKSHLKSKKTTQSVLLSEIYTEPTFDTKKRDKLLVTMKKLFVESRGNEATHLPSKRLNIKRIASGSQKLYKRRSREKIVTKKVNIILDLSGSMHSSIEDMQLIVDVLNRMSRLGIIDAQLILTGVKHGYAVHQCLEMPFKEETLGYLDAVYYGEGMDLCLRKNLSSLQSADYNLLLTDGYIDEEPLDKKFFASKQVKTHALYIGNEETREEMLESFDYVLCEKNVDELTQKIFTLFLH